MQHAAQVLGLPILPNEAASSFEGHDDLMKPDQLGYQLRPDRPRDLHASSPLPR